MARRGLKLWDAHGQGPQGKRTMGGGLLTNERKRYIRKSRKQEFLSTTLGMGNKKSDGSHYRASVGEQDHITWRKRSLRVELTSVQSQHPGLQAPLT